MQSKIFRNNNLW